MYAYEYYELLKMKYDVLCSESLDNLIEYVDAADVKTVAIYAPSAVVVASHMDTVSHLTVTRQDIKNLHLANVVVPDDNEILKF